MDTSTHLVVGLGLAGLAHVDPAIATNENLMLAVLIGTVVGSQAPDFDTSLRLKSNATYIRHHRGISHSIPFLFVWPALITLGISLIFPNVHWPTVALWTFIGEMIHVISDMFNAYGTKAYWPFSGKWISWNIIHIFDPIIFFSHLLALALWLFDFMKPSQIFVTLYGVILLYYIWKSIQHRSWLRKLPSLDSKHVADEQYWLIPTIHQYIWHVVKKSNDCSYAVGDLNHGKLQWVDKVHCNENHPAIVSSRSHEYVQSFLSFTSFASAECIAHSYGFEVRWVDVRYRHRKQYPFLAVLYMDHEYEVFDSYIGWASESRLQKKQQAPISE